MTYELDARGVERLDAYFERIGTMLRRWARARSYALPLDRRTGTQADCFTL